MTDAVDTATPADFGGGDVALNRDGSVRKKPGPKPGQRRASAPRPAAAKAPGLKAPKAPRRAPEQDFRPALIGLFQLPQVALTLGAKFAKRDETKNALQLDAITVGLHAPNLAEAINSTAQHDQKLAALCEKLSTVGPYSLVIGALLAPVGQILANHNVIPANEPMGILPPESLITAAGLAVADAS